MNIDLKLSIYRMIRNYICLRLIRIIFNDYNKWEKAFESNKLLNKELPLPGQLVPYSSAVNALSAIKIRGGSANLPLIIALYKFFHTIKKYIIKLIPKAFINYLADYNALKVKYPKLKYIEDILTVLISVATASIAIKTKTPKYILSFKVERDDTDVDFTIFAGKLGVNLDVCVFKNSIIFEALKSRNVCDREKVFAFREWLKEFSLSSNSGEKQGLLLCLIALLLYFYLFNYGLFIGMLEYLRIAVKEGLIPNSMLKVIIRRLTKEGVTIPDECALNN